MFFCWKVLYSTQRGVEHFCREFEMQMSRGSIHGSGKVGAANLFGARRGEGNDWLAAAQSAAED